ncbi:MAG: CHAT domain-containing tetratricopeptide repeat protein [Bacteroidota bacterium]
MNPNETLASGNSCRYLLFVFVIMVFCPCFGQGQTAQEAADERLQEINQDDFAGDRVAELAQLLEVYEQLPFDKNRVATMSRLAYELNDGSRPMSDSLALAAIELAKTSLGDSHAAATYYAYRALAQYHWDDYPAFQDYLDQSLLTFTDYNQSYFYVYKEKLIRAMDGYDVSGIQRINDQLTALFSGPDSALVAPYQVMLYDVKMILARFQQNGEQQIAYARKVLQLDEENPFYTVKDRIGVVADLAMSYMFIGQLTAAEGVLEKAMVKQQDHPEVLGTVQQALAVVYAEQERYAESVEVGKLAVECGERYGTVDLGSATYNLAFHQYLLGQYEEAHKTLQKAKNYIPPSVQFLAYDLEARIFGTQGRYSAGLNAAQSALVNVFGTFTDTAVGANPGIFDEARDVTWAGQILYHKAVCQAAIGQEQQNSKLLRMAQATNHLALAFATDSYSNLQGFELTQYHSLQNTLIRKSLQLETSIALDLYQLTNDLAYLDTAFLAFEQQKSAGLLQTMAPLPLPSEELERLDEAKRTLVDAQRAAALSDSPQREETKVIAAGEALAAIVQDLRTKYPIQSNHYFSIPYVSATTLQAHLPPGSALISYNIFADEPYAFLITADSKQRIPLPQIVDADNLGTKIKQYTQLLRSPLLRQRAKQEQLSSLGADLYGQLLSPLQSDLQGINHLVFVGELALRNLPFEALLIRPTKGEEISDWPFLIRDYQISYQYSATAYVLTQQKTSITNQSLLAFAPVFTADQQPSAELRTSDFPMDSLSRSITDGQFSPLPASRDEVLAIAQSLPASSQKTILLESEATKAALLRSLNGPSYQYVHIATHGLANLKEARRTALACYTEEEASAGLLYLDEIQLQAVKADLVVLSSCDSGLGRFAGGEGMLALNRAFLYAGARNVVSSLWKVSDEQTKNFMLHFYAALISGKSYSAALQAAKLQMLATSATSLPRYWSPFMLMGQ